MSRDKYKFSSVPPLSLVGEDVIEERGKQGYEMSRELLQYKVLLKDLTVIEVPYTIKNELLNIAFYIVNNVECYEKFQRRKEIPMTEVCKEFVKVKSFINQWREYIIAYTIILGNPTYRYLQDYLRVVEDDYEVDDINKAVQITKDNRERKGIVISTKGKTAIIMTSIGEFKKVKLDEKTYLGEEVTGNIKKTIKDYKYHVALFSTLLIILLGVSIFRYANVVSTVMVKTTSPIMLEVNVFNRIKSIDSNTERGIELIESIQVLDRSLDTALVNIIDYACNNGMLPPDGITVTVNGNPIKRGILDKTENYIYIEQVDVRFNNAGMEYKFN